MIGRNILSEVPTFSIVNLIRNHQRPTGITWMFAAKYDLPPFKTIWC